MLYKSSFLKDSATQNIFDEFCKSCFSHCNFFIEIKEDVKKAANLQVKDANALYGQVNLANKSKH